MKIVSRTPAVKIIAQLIAWGGEMIDSEGNYLPKTCYAHVQMKQSEIRRIISDSVVTAERGTGNWRVYNFVLNGKAYTLQAEVTWNATTFVKFSFDHRTPCDCLTASDLWEGAL